MTEPLAGRNVVLGVSGSIAAYKALTIASRLTAAGAAVDVILTRIASEMVRPLAFQALTHRPVVTSLWEPTGPMALDHVSLAHGADLLVVAPATAHVLARVALGLADDALTTTVLATRAPIVIAPAMEPSMWSNPATQGHVETLRSRGVHLVGPVEGRMASGQTGVGRLAEPDVVLEHLRLVLARKGDLAGQRALVTAGPTREPLDPVRFLSNRSSGRMGYALAREARNRGADVTLISGPTVLNPPVGVDVTAVETALEMREAVLANAPEVDVVIMTAAVADFRPVAYSAAKIKKADADSTLPLVRNPDILLDLNEALAGKTRRPVRVGFAAETDAVIENAQAKLARKSLDFIVANPVPASFAGEHQAATLVSASGATPLGEVTKAAVAAAVLDRVAALLAEREAVSADAETGRGS